MNSNKRFRHLLVSMCGIWLLAVSLLLATYSQSLAFTLNVVDADTGVPISGGFRYLVEEDNTNLTVPGVLVNDSIVLDIHNSHAPVVTEGASGSFSTNVSIPDTTRYFVTVLPDGDFALSGASVAIEQDTVTVRVQSHPLPTAQISVFTHVDHNPINNTWDAFDGGVGPDAVQNGGLGGFTIIVHDAAGQMLTDAFGNALNTTYLKDPFGDFILGTDGMPVVDQLGDGTITTLTKTDFDLDNNPYNLKVGEVLIKNLAPGKYGLTVIAPTFDDSGNPVEFVQTATIEGTTTIDAWVKANEPELFIEGFGTGFNHAAFGFVKVSPTEASTINGQVVNVTPWNITDAGDPDYVDRSSFTGSIEGTLHNNHFSRPPATQGFFSGNEIEDCWVGLNNPVATPTGLEGLYTAPCDPDSGHFLIENVPPGTYQLVSWDSALDNLFGLQTVTVPPGEAVNLGDVLVFRWFGTLEGSVFLDDGAGDPALANNGFRDPGEGGLPLQDLNLRFRDGTIYQATLTDLGGNYQFSEVFPFFKWLVVETGFVTLKDTGFTNVVDYGGEVLPDSGWAMPTRGKLTPQPQATINPNTGNDLSRTEVSGSPGETLLQAMHLFLGQTNVIDWGKAPYGPGLDGIHGTVDDENGGIAGIVYYAVTRAEDDPAYAAGEEWEPGIPRVQVAVYRDHNADGVIDAPGILADIDNHPLGWADGGDMGPEDIDRIGPNGVFEWGAAVDITWTDSWDDNKPSGCIQDLPVIHGSPIPECADAFGTWNQIRPGVFDGGYAIGGLTADTYIVESAVPPGYELMQEEDKNVDFGDPWTPGLMNLPPVCVDYDDKGDGNAGHLVPAELALFPGIAAPNAGTIQPYCDRKQIYVTGGKNADVGFWLFTEVPKAARAVGFVNNDLAAEPSPDSPNFGEKIAPAFIPISIQDWKGVEITRVYVDEFGGYNALLPSTLSVNVPSPTGVSPQMLTLVLNEPIMADGSIDPYYDPNYTVTPWTFNFMPGATTYLDTPIIPIAAFATADIKLDTEPADASPVISEVNGPGGGPLLCSDVPETSITLTSAGPTTIRNPAYDFTVPGSTINITRDFGFGAQGPGSTVTLDGTLLTIDSWTDGTIDATVPGGASTGTLLVTRDDTGATTQVGVTLNIENCTTTTVRRVPSGYGTIQAAIDAAGAGDLILVAAGTYNESVIVYKPVHLQGAGAAGTFINANPRPIDRLQAWHARIDALGGSDFTNYLNEDPFAAAEAPGFFVLGEFVYPGGTLNPGNPFSAAQAMIDGFSISGSKSGGGIIVFAGGDGTVISNNEITGNSGSYAGGISIGTLDEGLDSQNPNVVIRDNKIHRNGGIQGPGGIGLHEGSHNYLVENNVIHGNLGRFNGGGIAHRGLSLGNNVIRGNRILFNEVSFGAVTNKAGDGGGIFVGDLVSGLTGSGNVTIDSNLIQGNMSGVGYGGGIRAFAVNGGDVATSPDDDTSWYQLKIVNNIIVNNVAALSGAGISLMDVARAEIVNNTIANNDSTATGVLAFEAGAANSTPQPAGIVAGEHSAILQGYFGTGLEQTYSNPVLENNILWHNRSFFNDASLNAGAGGLAANPAGPYWDLGVVNTVGPPPALNPDYSLLSSLTGPNGENYNDGTNLAANPAFVLGYSNALESATVIDEGGNAITLRFTPLDANAGDYHIAATSPAVEVGAAVAIPEQDTDFDGDARPSDSGVDIGADEVPGATVLRVLTPNGGESFFGGTSTDINWSPHPNATTYDVRLSFNGTNFWTIASGITGTSYAWTVPNNNASTAVVRVVARNGGVWTGSDDSDASFTIIKGGTVLSPDGGETFTGGTVQSIQWTPHPNATNYDVRLSYNGGASFWTIASGITGTSHAWIVLNNNVSAAVVRVVSRNGASWVGADASDGTFTIVKP